MEKKDLIESGSVGSPQEKKESGYSQSSSKSFYDIKESRINAFSGRELKIEDKDFLIGQIKRLSEAIEEKLKLNDEEKIKYDIELVAPATDAEIRAAIKNSQIPTIIRKIGEDLYAIGRFSYSLTKEKLDQKEKEISQQIDSLKAAMGLEAHAEINLVKQGHIGHTVTVMIRKDKFVFKFEGEKSFNDAVTNIVEKLSKRES